MFLINFFRRLFSSQVIAKVAIARVLANNPKYASVIALVAGEASAALGPSAVMSADGLRRLMQEKAGVFAPTPEEAALLDEVLLAITTELGSRQQDVVPLLTWLATR
jgi:hypothetical protein